MIADLFQNENQIHQERHAILSDLNDYLHNKIDYSIACFEHELEQLAKSLCKNCLDCLIQ
ncbi:hypothetical protein [Alysiella crassa]|uniref:Uncharacterized protein n=1 Tax=Alysiella crassa TaxID=153491 RepID=A0A376BTB2_9NEIS|nr:hypothetical protein [Alysiella crassa]UOP07971.1 hypothetical protein LVJ80_06545 [Alysiella crassa]SSY80033.1 Uncharacterised protein [Alysiella crassa]